MLEEKWLKQNKTKTTFVSLGIGLVWIGNRQKKFYPLRAK
jgi:hypothetical protein